MFCKGLTIFEWPILVRATPRKVCRHYAHAVGGYFPSVSFLRYGFAGIIVLCKNHNAQAVFQGSCSTSTPCTESNDHVKTAVTNSFSTTFNFMANRTSWIEVHTSPITSSTRLGFVLALSRLFSVSANATSTSHRKTKPHFRKTKNPTPPTSLSTQEVV